MLTRTALLISITATAACGGAGASDDALVGRWDLTDDETGELEAIYVFADDGGFRYREYGDSPEDNQGTYEADGQLLRLEATDEDGSHLVGEVTYFADDQRLMLGALLPVGEVDGPVGTWKGSVYTARDGEAQLDDETTYELSSGGGAVIRGRRNGSEVGSRQGTWADEPEGIVVMLEESGINVNIHLSLIDGAALGNPIYTRAN